MSLEDISIPQFVQTGRPGANHAPTQALRSRASSLQLKRRAEAEKEAALDALQADKRTLGEQIKAWFDEGNAAHVGVMMERFGRTSTAIDAALRRLEEKEQASRLRNTPALCPDGRIRTRVVWGAYDPMARPKRAPGQKNVPMIEKAVSQRSALDLAWFRGGIK
jgi:hypothetical protein